MIPEWLSQRDNYVPVKEKNSYMEKSIFSIIKSVSIIKQNKNRDKLIYILNPSVKVIATIVNIILISLSRSSIYVGAVDIYVMVNILLMEKRSRKRIFLRSLIFPILTLIVLIPSMIYGNIYNSLLLFQKIVTTILFVNLLAHNTRWSEINKSLKLIFVPDIFIWIMDITIKYIVLLGEYSINLLYALKLRSVGRNTNKYRYITGIMGNLFIKSYKMSEEMFHAMECRGFVGEYTARVNLQLKKIDYFYILINILIISLFIYSIY